MKVRILTLKWAATCAECGAALPVGAQARWYPGGKTYGVGCHPAKAPTPKPAEELAEWIERQHGFCREDAVERTTRYICATWTILPEGVMTDYPELWVRFKRAPRAAERAEVKAKGLRWHPDSRAWWAPVVPLASIPVETAVPF